MRNSRFVKIITVILAVVLLASLAFAVSALANGEGESGEPARVTVVSKNASYESKTHLVFALKCDDLGANEEIVLLFWNTDPAAAGKSAEELYQSAAYRKTAYEKNASVLGVDGCELIFSNGIAACNINSDIYVLPIIRAVDDSGETPVYTYTKGADLFTYSVKAYAEERLTDTDNTDAQNRLYNNLIEYGNAAEKLFSAN